MRKSETVALAESFRVYCRLTRQPIPDHVLFCGSQGEYHRFDMPAFPRLADLNPARRAVVDLLATLAPGDRLTGAEIADEIGREFKYVHEMLAALLNDGIVENHRPGYNLSEAYRNQAG